MLRTTAFIDGEKYPLAQDQDIPAIQNACVDAARAGAGMVSFVVVGNRAVTVLVTPVIRVLFVAQEVAEDDRDTGDPEAPFIPEIELDY